MAVSAYVEMDLGTGLIASSGRACLHLAGRSEVERLLERHRKDLFLHAYRLTRNRDAASDLTQNTSLRILRCAEDFDGRGPFINWAYKIMSNLKRDHLRMVNRRVKTEAFADFHTEEGDYLEYEGRDPSPGPDSDVLSAAGIEDILSVLYPTTREMCRLVLVEGLTYGEASVILRRPEGTIRSQVNRAKEKLKRHVWSIMAADPASTTEQ